MARTPDYKNSPVAWFVILDRALEAKDFARAAEAQRELERLGVRVRFRRKSRAAGCSTATGGKA